MAGARGADVAGGLATRTLGRAGGPRVVLVHGFTQTMASWAPLLPALGDRLELVLVDAPGHGGSPGVPAGMGEAAAALGEAGGRAAYVGYSMGGRLCLRLALDRPDLVGALVLIGASPGLADPAELAARAAADEALAEEIERDGAEAFVDRWLGQPLFATLPPEAAGRADRLANRPEGLSASLRRLGTGAQAPLWDRLGSLAMPVLLLAGAEDHKFAAVAARMAAAIGPSARVELVAGAGHAAHLERPAEVAATVAGFLDAVGVG
jgi:2-succinyl-6-hydroxy-2,4-cyclohexadiene-1-carboxylate synthase